MANLQLYNQNFPANGKMIFDPGNFFFLLSAAAAVNLLLINQSNTEILNGIVAGTQIKRTKIWKQAILSGTPGSNFQCFHGDEFSREDQTNFLTTIATIAGSVAGVAGIGSANALTNHADVSVPATTLDNTIAANANRKLLIIGSNAENAPGGSSLNLRVQGGAGVAAAEGVQLQPGQNFTFGTYSGASAAAYAVYNPAAVAQKYWWIEGT